MYVRRVLGAGVLVVCALLGCGGEPVAEPVAERHAALTLPVGASLDAFTWTRNLQTGDQIAFQPERYYRHCAANGGGAVSSCWNNVHTGITSYSGAVSLQPRHQVWANNLLTVEVVNPPATFAYFLNIRLRTASGSYLKFNTPVGVNRNFSGLVETQSQSEAAIFELQQGGVYWPGHRIAALRTASATGTVYPCGFMGIFASTFTVPPQLGCGYDASGVALSYPVTVLMQTPYLRTNLARGRPASQSSTYNSDGPAWKAVDGNLDGVWSGGSITHTNFEAQPWWQVDLGAVLPIGQVVIHNRMDDCCYGRLARYKIRLSNDGVNFWDAAYFAGGAYFTAEPFNFANTSARYVRVQLTDSNALSLAEVQVFPPLENVALGRPAFQTSTAFGGVADRAVDGNLDGGFGGGSVTHSDWGEFRAWRVDLQQVRDVDQVIVYNRTDCCGDRLSGATVKIINEWGTIVPIASLPSWPGVERININQRATGVMVQLNTGNYLSLAEVIVLGR